MDLHFDCFYYYVSDMERAVSFYRDVLGLQLASRDQVARFEIDGLLFELVPGKPGGGVGGSLCLKTADLAKTAEELTRRGVPVSDPRSVENGTLAFLEDPDGNQICLWQYLNE